MNRSARTNPAGVLYVADGSHMGGGNVVLMNLLEHLDRSRFVPAIAVPDDGPLQTWAMARDIPCVVVRGRDAAGRAAQFRRAVGLAAHMVRRRTRIVHAMAPLSYRAAGLAASLVGAARVCHLGFPPGPGELEWCFQFGPDRVLACHDGQARDVGEAIQRIRPSCRIVAVPNGVDTDLFAPAGADVIAKTAWRFGAAHVVVIVGHLSEVKGYPIFLKAAARIAAELQDCAFVALGGETTTPGYRAYLDRFATELGIERRVHFLGRRSDVADVVRSADVMVLPSLAEGLPLAILEAMACARPVVATAVGGTPEAVVDGVSGLLVAPGDVEGLARGVLRLLRDRELARRMGEEGRRRVEEAFSLTRAVHQVEDVYQELAERKSWNPRRTSRRHWPSRQAIG